IGLARETGVINNQDVNVPSIEPVPAAIDDTFSVKLAAPEACPRFAGRVIRNIDLDAQTPLWMQEKLRRAGMRPIDPVVDVTNYIMLELGQPMHAYDLDRLTDKIIVRQSRAGEQVTLLDGHEITLNEDTLLITDGSGPIGMAGIMGGLETAVTQQSRNIFLESAFFSPLAISGRARSYGLNTDASHRFERGVDWQGQVRALERATQLLLDIAGGEAGPTTEVLDNSALPDVNEVAVRPGRVKRLLGVDIANNDIDQMLTRLGFEHKKIRIEEEEAWLVSAPSHRFDIEIEADLIEEISRVYGYNNLPVRTPQSWLTMALAPEGRLSIDRIREQLVARGYFEAITYSFVDPRAQAALDPQNDPVALANPVSNEMSVMRTTLWPGLLKSLIYNLNRQQEQIRLFEVGLRFVQPPNQKDLNMDSLDQSQMLAGVACGARQGENWANGRQPLDFFDIKGDLETLLTLTGAAHEFTFELVQHPALHPGQSAQINRNGERAGYIGLLDPRVQQSLDIKTPVYLFELKTSMLIAREVPAVDALSRHPEVRRDIAIIVGEAVTAAQIEACIRETAGRTLKHLTLFDVYQGKGIDPNAKSLALGLTFQHPDRTLTDEEINTQIDKVVASLEKEFGARLRR
ncbi:MAG: phenylalanine--tRNA ligase subunit beta, partial [Pseudomonadales bacterium]